MKLSQIYLDLYEKTTEDQPCGVSKLDFSSLVEHLVTLKTGYDIAVFFESKMTDLKKRNVIESSTSSTMFTMKEASEFLGVSKSTLYKYNLTNIIPYSKPTGRKIYYRVEDLTAFLECGFDV